MTGKNQRIMDTIKYLQTKYGADNIIIRDLWESDECAIGVTDQSNRYLGYISTVTAQDDNYFLALENPPVNDNLPYSSAGDFDNITLMELEHLLVRHLRLIG